MGGLYGTKMLRCTLMVCTVNDPYTVLPKYSVSSLNMATSIENVLRATMVMLNHITIVRKGIHGYLHSS